MSDSAFCPLIKANCSAPTDCNQCSHMRAAITAETKWKAAWVCADCVKTRLQAAREGGPDVRAPGFFAEGPCESEVCERTQRAKTPEEAAEARHSIVLQLLLY